MVHADAIARAGLERAAAEADATRAARAAVAATGESAQAAAWAARDEAAAAAEAQAHEKGTKRRLEQEAELKERLALGVGTPECRKQMLAEMKSSDGGLHGLDARTGQGLKLDESVRQLRRMRARLAATNAENHKHARQVPPNDPVHTAETDIFLGMAAQASPTTLPSAPLSGAVEAVHALMKLKQIQLKSNDGSTEHAEANGAHKRLLD